MRTIRSRYMIMKAMNLSLLFPCWSSILISKGSMFHLPSLPKFWLDTSINCSGAYRWLNSASFRFSNKKESQGCLCASPCQCKFISKLRHSNLTSTVAHEGANHVVLTTDWARIASYYPAYPCLVPVENCSFLFPPFFSFPSWSPPLSTILLRKPVLFSHPPHS